MIKYVFLLLMLVLPSGAQTPADTPYTLHVYQDLVQIPVLVADKMRKSKLGLVATDFSIRIDSGPVFHPSRSHLEGDDPLSVILLLDVTDESQREFLVSLEKHLADLPPTLFRPQDRLSVFAFDCKFVVTAQDQPASNSLLQSAVSGALASPDLHGDRHQPCVSPVFLWDAINGAASLADTTPGRRVMFVLSPGRDKHSTHAWETARRYAGGLGFSLIGMRDVGGVIGAPEDPFAMLCSGTGGLDVYVTPQTITHSLPYLFDLIRNRYIVEFPRPSNGTKGLHHLDVTVADQSLVVRSGGDSTPLLDNSTLSNPTLTPDAAPRPMLGNRKPLDPKP